ncbi:MAG TPA: potassium/proton antiporter [Acidimicrobiia bacterium]|nr:potassium/proton antiporter [Acidimicrobiia bacterium]
MPSFEPVFVVAILLLLGVLAGKLSSRFGVPALLLFLLIGMLAGSDGPGGIDFTNAPLAAAVGSIALALILFSGGLDTRWQAVRPVLWSGISLATVGTLITGAVAGLAAVYIFDYPLLFGLLAGSIISSTDAAAVFSILRSRGIGLRGKLRPLLELESATNDPMAVFLTLGLSELIVGSETEPISLVFLFIRQMGLGALVGIAFARAAVWVLNKIKLEYEGLYPVLTLAIVLLVFSAASAVEGSGFLAVYLAGLTMSRHRLIHKRSLARFHDGVGWLMQIAMFLVLGLLVFPSQIPGVAPPSLGLALVLMFIARPLAVWVTLIFSGFSWREKALIAWVGLRGALPIVLATFPLAAGVPLAPEIFNVVFFVVLLSVALQGTTIARIASWLGVVDTTAAEGDRPELVTGGDDNRSITEVTIPANSWVDGRRVVELDFPTGMWLSLIARGDEFLVPQGPTVLKSGDRLTLLASENEKERVLELLESGSAQTPASRLSRE